MFSSWDLSDHFQRIGDVSSEPSVDIDLDLICLSA